MQIKKVKLENIRSYENAEVNFPDGSILLSGDIGSGKSTILLALEFALFGIQPGYLSGSSLLKKSSDSGSVEIEIELENKSIKIKRSLERKKTSVGQGKDCFIEIEGKREQLSPEDLKAKVLELLNYPQSMLKARTNLLYRFTIYTPQEEMKYILLEKPEERINTLRKIFSIDKYKNIISNLDIISSKIKERIKLSEARIFDLESKKQDKLVYEDKSRLEQSEIKNISPMLMSLQMNIEQDRKKLQGLNLQIKQFQTLKTEIISLKINLKNNEDQKQRNTREIERIEKNLQESVSSVPQDMENKDFRQEILKLKLSTEEKDRKIREFFSEIAIHEAKKREMNEIEKRIHDLIECPYCKQVVSEEHKQKILNESKKKIEDADKNAVKLKQEREILEKDSRELKEKIDSLHEKEKEHEKIKLKMQLIADQKKIHDNLIEELKSINIKRIEIEGILKTKEQDLENMKDVEKIYQDQNNILEEKSRKERDLAIKKAEHEKQLQYYVSRILEIEKEIKEKEQIKDKISRLKKMNEWISDHISELLLSIEKNVMLAINVEFNKMFEKWFSMLTENLSARINEDFTPIIEQQGYEIDYEALSGGERTAAALAYRLSLNQIINNLMSKLNTRGLIILDEPTDGFSTEQLEKMRNILDELKTEQMILVSHEAKIENFVQNIIRFEKKDGKSHILTYGS
jgi:exonuclease SbcC